MPKQRKTRFRSRRQVAIRNLTKNKLSNIASTIQAPTQEPFRVIGVPICDTEPTFLIEPASSADADVPCELSGRRIVSIQYFLTQIKHLNVHKPFDCNFSDMYAVREQQEGLISHLVFKCRVCNIEKKNSTDEVSNNPNEGYMDVNSAAVVAAISTGNGHTQMVEQQAILDLPQLSFRQYTKYHSDISDVIYQSAYKAMEEGGQEELRLAQEVGDIDAEGCGLITVIADGAWSKRSYKVNYDAPSGVGCIVGAKTGKILFVASRNKYCPTCTKYTVTNTPVPQHKCCKNWKGSSTAMESDIVVEGFRRSVEMHRLKYVNLVGDGDSSVYKKLCIERPYGPRVAIKKVECTNHLLRNSCTRIRTIVEKRMSSAGQVVSVELRKLVKQRLEKLRTGIKCAIMHRRKEDCDTEQQIANLKKDIDNCPYHVFGEHLNCSSYFCQGFKPNEDNYVTLMIECGLMADLKSAGSRLSQNASSLILNMNNNAAETYNSVVCKFVGGKRQNFSLKNSYNTRCHAAALSYNTQERYFSHIHKTLTGRSPGKHTKAYMTKIKRRKETRKVRRQLFRSTPRRRASAPPDPDYGMVEEGIQPLEIEELKHKFLSDLTLSKEEIIKLERNTRGQSSNLLWKAERTNRLTASNFGIICRKRSTTDPKRMIQNIIGSGFTGSAATKWGQNHEQHAIAQFEGLHTPLKVNPCGLFVYEKHCFLGASPDGIIDDNTIIEIKCPYSAANMSIAEGVANKKIMYLIKDSNSKLMLKKTHKYYYQIQGQLEITNTKFCYFVVWTCKDIFIEKIEKDQDFCTGMINTLVTFYLNDMLPAVLKKSSSALDGGKLCM